MQVHAAVPHSGTTSQPAKDKTRALGGLFFFRLVFFFWLQAQAAHNRAGSNGYSGARSRGGVGILLTFAKHQVRTHASQRSVQARAHADACCPAATSGSGDTRRVAWPQIMGSESGTAARRPDQPARASLGDPTEPLLTRARQDETSVRA